jgi:hypothetical protein
LFDDVPSAGVVDLRGTGAEGDPVVDTRDDDGAGAVHGDDVLDARYVEAHAVPGDQDRVLGPGDVDEAVVALDRLVVAEATDGSSVGTATLPLGISGRLDGALVSVPPPPEIFGRSRALLGVESPLEKRLASSTANPTPTTTAPTPSVATINHHQAKPPDDRGGVPWYGVA